VTQMLSGLILRCANYSVTIVSGGPRGSIEDGYRG